MRLRDLLSTLEDDQFIRLYLKWDDKMETTICLVKELISTNKLKDRKVLLMQIEKSVINIFLENEGN